MSNNVTAHTKGVLISGVGNKVPLIEAVKKASSNVGAFTKVYGRDTNPYCVGQYFVDQFWHTPPLEKMHRKEIRDFCLERQIGAIIPTKEEELPFFAKEAAFFQDCGIVVLVSPLDAIYICEDKYLFYQKLCEWGLVCIPTYFSFAEVQAEKKVVKERFDKGQNQRGISSNPKEVERVSSKIENPIYQPFIEGTEYSIDVYRDKHKKMVGTICRGRITGESECSITTTVEKPEIEALAAHLANKLDLWGPAVFQGIEQPDGEFLFIECNPRFGSASTLSIAAGLDIFSYFFKECLDQEPVSHAFKTQNKTLRLVRFPKDIVVPWES